MGSLNAVMVIGNLGRDAELRYTPSGAAVATFNLATKEVWNDKSGNRQERTEWHRCVLWGRPAQSLAEYLTKGKQVYVSGKLQTRSWEDKEHVTRYTTEIRVDKVVLLSGGTRPGRDDSHVSDETVGHGEPSTQLAGEPLMDDDIPF